MIRKIYLILISCFLAVSFVFPNEDIIRINSMDKDSLINLKDVPFNASIGLFGHEFNHIIDYRYQDRETNKKKVIEITIY